MKKPSSSPAANAKGKASPKTKFPSPAPVSASSGSDAAANPTWRALLVDDDAIARSCLRAFLGQHPEVAIVAEASDLASAARAARDHLPNLIFLDIHLDTEDGFSLLPHLPAPPHAPEIVFVTSEKARALQAFEVGAVGYLLKPITAPRLAETLTRLRSPASTAKEALDGTLDQNDTVLLREAGRLHAISIEKISLILAEGSFTHVHLRTGEKLFLSQTIGKWEASLPPALFLRLDRSTLVNRSRITKAEARSRNCTLLHVDPLPAPVELGRIGASRLRKLLLGDK